MAVTALLAGAATDVTAQVAAHVGVAGASCRLGVALDDAFTSPVYTSAVTADADGWARFDLSGLTAGTRYRYRVEVAGVLDTRMGKFRTHPAAPGSSASFTAAFGSCAPGSGHPPSTAAVHTAIANRDPLVMLHLGDLHYQNIATNDASLFRAAAEGATTATNAKTLYEGTTLDYVWDDHDFGVDNTDSTNPAKDAAASAFRQVFPHYTLPDAGAVYHAFTIGRVRFIVTDERYFRDVFNTGTDASRSVLGATQKQWFKDQLAAAKADQNILLAVWVSTQSPHTTVVGSASWGDFTTERRELWDYFASSGVASKLIILAGDIHASGYRKGVDYSTIGNAPVNVYVSSGLEQSYSPVAGETAVWDAMAGPSGYGGTGLYATLGITDHTTWLGVTVAIYGVTPAGAEAAYFTHSFNVGTVPPTAGVYAVRDGRGNRYGVYDNGGVQRYVAYS